MDPLSGTVETQGLLLRDGGGFRLNGDDGRRWLLDLSRVPIELVAKRAAVSGVETAPGRLEVIAIRAG